MYIKSSGFLLADMTSNSGYVTVRTSEIQNIVNNSVFSTEIVQEHREKIAKNLLQNTILNPKSDSRPSIETFLHAMLGKYTLHTHPIAVNILACRKDWNEALLQLFPDALLVKYVTPGIDLAIELNKELNIYLSRHNRIPEVIFLQNHGLIVTSNVYEKIEILTNEVVNKIADSLEISLGHFSLTNEISSLISSIYKKKLISLLCEDGYINNILTTNKSLLSTPPMCPDTLVFCGFEVVDLDNNNPKESILKYIDKYNTHPKVVIYKGRIAFVGNAIKKVKEAEEVFKFHLMSVENSYPNVNSLSVNELHYLNNWEAEKFRQSM
jgi:rhamnose utilization protein RhaD (predicted bifunctional aldolase and dehydrogenase)